jgi:GDPmannose 4,6-dehydratase
LDWTHFVETDATMFRPSEIRFSYADPIRAERTLGWRAKHSMHDVVRLMLAAEMDADHSVKPTAK